MEIKINERSISLTEPEPFLSILKRTHIYFPLYCGGMGSCGKCRIQVVEGSLPVTMADRQFFNHAELEAGFRLGCQAIVDRPCSIRFEAAQQEDKFFVPSMQIPEQQVSKTENIPSESKTRWSIAVDIGSTTIVMALVDARTGKMSREYSGLNHQRSYGTDVMARIRSAVADGQGKAMQACIRQDLADGLQSLLQTSVDTIEEIVIAGNTTMLHLLRGYDCSGLAAYPFQPKTLDFEEISTKMLLGEQSVVDSVQLKDTKVVLLPGFSAFVGADITAGLWGCGLEQAERPRLFLDLGTNAEMAVGNRNGMVVSSAAAGPAFEGGQLSCGTGSIPGAVKDVQMQYGLVRYTTIGKRPPIGICGSGLVAAISEMRRNGIMDDSGRLNARYAAKGMQIIPGRIVITQADVREYQKARAAIRAGMEILVDDAGYRMEEIECLELAGGFGSQLDLSKAVGAGLIPECLKDRVHILGNAVNHGLCHYICHPDAEGIRKMIQKTREISLANQRNFTKTFLEFSCF